MFFGKKEKEPETEEEMGVPPGEEGDPFTVMNRIKRWWALRNGWTVLRTVDYDEERREYNLTEEMVRKENLPLDAVHCTGEPHYYALDMVRVEYGPHDNEFSAMNACLYMDCNKISDGLAVKWSGNIPWKMIAIGIAVAVVIGVVGYFAYMKV